MNTTDHQHVDAVILDAGPGGYVAAIHGAQLGKRVAIVEQQYWGLAQRRLYPIQGAAPER